MESKDLLIPNKGIIPLEEAMTKDYKLMAFFFQAFRPIRYDLDLMGGRYYILCESVLFDQVEEGCAIPLYSIEVRNEPDGTLTLVDVQRYQN